MSLARLCVRPGRKDEGDVHHFLSLVREGAGSTTWEWPHDQLRSIVEALPPSALGSGGLPHAFWAATRGDKLPWEMLDSNRT